MLAKTWVQWLAIIPVSSFSWASKPPSPIQPLGNSMPNLSSLLCHWHFQIPQSQPWEHRPLAPTHPSPAQTRSFLACSRLHGRSSHWCLFSAVKSWSVSLPVLINPIFPTILPLPQHWLGVQWFSLTDSGSSSTNPLGRLHPVSFSIESRLSFLLQPLHSERNISSLSTSSILKKWNIITFFCLYL